MKRSIFLKTALLSLSTSTSFSAFSQIKPKSRAKKGFKTEVQKTRYPEKITLGNTPVDFKLLGDDTGDELSIFISSNNIKGFGPPLPFHNNFDEFFCVLDGDFVFQLGDEKIAFKKGETIYVPRKIKHCFNYIGDKSGTLLVAISPSKNIELFFARMGEIINNSKGEPDTKALQSLYHKFDSEIVGPPMQ
ncbi:MAG TPA: cupin domain-containing protein [Puia sp.]|nr:cupin domain-containing protein [Puia sp.]